ncbi:hypothetical protein [Accumulibacter sp.]|uniref:hypothetical protein n=1 Tax=Accumulibacter sp. TaxID=2053492 RepID=UPI0025F5EA41|nr:hypothetical protein [Accumulibacter sp.]MCM8613509.1 hypothetical protein [Accumulibacter sp.]MCM8637176.1 hypothetical protein [Accumulibacter sp.]MCM8640760.1 hypothetical protein [Accumulibacter sp.]
MSRSLFGAWGAALPQESFARAVAAAALLGVGREHAPPLAAARSLGAAAGEIAVLRLERLAAVLSAIADGGLALPPAEEFVAAWQGFSESRPAAGNGGRPLLRLEIEPPSGADRWSMMPELPWLFGLLLGNGGDLASSAYLRLDGPQRAICWDWPLRIAIVGDTRAADLAAALAASRWPELLRIVAPGEDCQLLLLPEDLRRGLARVLQSTRRLRAASVLVLGGAGTVGERILPLAAALCAEVSAGGVGVAAVERERQGESIESLLAHLARDLPFDVALQRALPAAQDEAGGEPALLIASRRLASEARLSAVAQRLAQQVDRLLSSARSPVGGASARSPADGSGGPLGDEVAALARSLAASTARTSWADDAGEASELARLRSALAGRLGGSRGEQLTAQAAARDGAGDAASGVGEQRRLNGCVIDVSDAARPLRVEDRLAVDRAYVIDLDIGLPRAQVLSAPEVFPSGRLPPSDAGHWLDLFFVPLVRGASGRLHTPQQGRLFLPAEGDSQACRLSFRTHGVRDEYRARILIVHETRILQTLILSSPLAGTDGRLALTVENRVAASFDPSPAAPPFDAAIVVNHAASGQAGFTTVVGSEVSFREPLGIDRLVDEVKALLSAEASFTAARGSLDDPALLQLFDALARYGRSLLKAMPAPLQGRVPEGARIQIVEARAGAWLPVEILYAAPLPQAGATLCPNARAALLGEGSHEQCAHRDDRSVHCPLRFWGLSCVIERQPEMAATSAADYTISLPRPGGDRLDVLRSVLVGASKRVRAQDLGDPGGLLDAVRQSAKSARTVRDWAEWERAIAADSPSLLLLLPHSQEDPAHPGISGLEIGGVLLTRPELESSYVAGPAAAAPVVLLLGCSTQLSEVPFLNFVEAFKRERAALVIGTLATIRGRRAVTFVAELLAALQAAAGGDESFGEVFLATRRRLLAGGDGFALSLTAYGDVGWRL